MRNGYLLINNNPFITLGVPQLANTLLCLFFPRVKDYSFEFGIKLYKQQQQRDVSEAFRKVPAFWEVLVVTYN